MNERRLIILFFIYLVLEGALRKWLFPQLATPLFLIKDLLTALSADGKTILYSSHVLDVVEKVCHRILVIDHGNLIADAPLEELKTRTSEKSLEDILRKLTHSEDTAPKIARVMEVLRS